MCFLKCIVYIITLKWHCCIKSLCFQGMMQIIKVYTIIRNTNKVQRNILKIRLFVCYLGLFDDIIIYRKLVKRITKRG